MSEPENFLERWSRRKREAETPAPDLPLEQPRAEASQPDEASLQDKAAAPITQHSAGKPGEPAFDPASLPSVDSIGADTDIRAFLQPGVPPDLTRAALRRAWSSDPAIRDFMGPVENGWDFNDPGAIAGFGPISTDEIPRLLAQVFGTPGADEPKRPQQGEGAATTKESTQTQTAPTAGIADETSHDDAAAEAGSPQCSSDIASQKDADV